MADKESRTEKATPRRKEQARQREGKVATSKEFYSVAVLIAGTAALCLVMDRAGGALLAFCRKVLGGLPEIATGGSAVWYEDALPTAALFLVPVSLAGATSVLATGFSQTRGLFTFKVIKLKLDKLNPLPKLKQMFISKQAAITLLQAAAKVGIITAFTFHLFWKEIQVVLGIGSRPPVEILSHLAEAVLRLGIRVVLLMLVFAVVDYVLAVRRYNKDLRMSHQELKEEHKQYEGDPEVKRQLYKRRLEMSRNRMMAEVANADVVLVNPTHYAVALRYSAAEMSAPQVTAKGEGEMARRIREKARSCNIPVMHNPPLTRAIFAEAKPGDEIPSRLFSLVAEVLAHIYKLRGRLG